MGSALPADTEASGAPIQMIATGSARATDSGKLDGAMDLHQLRVFQAAIKTGGFTRAGEQLHLSQSTVSQHIKLLEEELGCSLFLRVGKRVLVTAAGNVLLQYAERIFRDLKNAEMAVREMNALKRGAPCAWAWDRPRSPIGCRRPARDYIRRFPQIELIVIAGTTEFLLDALQPSTWTWRLSCRPPAARRSG